MQFDAGPGGVAGIVAVHRDGAAIGVDDEAAIGSAGIIVLGVEARQNRQEGQRIDGGRDNRQPVGRSTAGRIDGLIDNVVAVTRIVDVGVVTQATVEGVVAGAADEDVVAAEAVQSVVPAKAQEQVIAGSAGERVVTRGADDYTEAGISELQPLDAGERVGAVGLEAIGHDCVGYSYRAIRVGTEGIVLEIVAERGRIDVGVASPAVVISRMIWSWPGLILPSNIQAARVLVTVVPPVRAMELLAPLGPSRCKRDQTGHALDIRIACEFGAGRPDRR